MKSAALLSFLGALLVLPKSSEAFRDGSPQLFNITDYLSSISDSRLRARAEAALIAEQHTKSPEWLGELAGCPSPPRCPPSRYRAQAGLCNNVRRPLWGAAGTPFLRLAPPVYADGLSGTPQPPGLPPPQMVAAALTKLQAGVNEHSYVTGLAAVWGDMLAHDLAATININSVDCCTHNHPECYPERSNKTCNAYMRSLPSISDDCKLEVREQMNAVTAFLDGSAVYDELGPSYRKMEEGRVDVDACSRCREKSALGALYSVLLQEHNNVASKLAALNSHWSDETVFQEARRIVVAEIQHITFNEFLPTVLGQIVSQRPELKLKEQGYFTSYSSSNHAGTINSVATTALQIFRFMVPESLMDGKNVSKDSSEPVIQKLLNTPASIPLAHTPYTSTSNWNVASLLIHRGRDHGLPPYVQWLKLCPMSSDHSRQTHNIPEESLSVLKKIYSDPGLIDLFVGGVLETELDGAIVGPTFTCLLAHQFALVRNSDRFWYENDLPPSSFSKKQLQELRKVTLAGLLCANMPTLEQVQSRVFIQEDPYLNVRISCELQPSLDLSAWLDDEVISSRDIKMKAVELFPTDLLMQAMEKAEEYRTERQQKEYEFWKKNGGADPKSPVGTAAAFSKANKYSLHLANTSILLEFASEEILNSLQRLRRSRRQALFDAVRDDILGFSADLGDDFVTNGLQSIDIRPFIPAGEYSPDCDSPEDRAPCDPAYPYRSITGRCNNLRNPNLGKSTSTFARLLPAAYENAIARPRLSSVSGGPLPSPRLISTTIHVDISNLHNRYSLMLMQFAQFLDHDLTFTPVHRGFFTSIPDCRSCNSPNTVHPECMPIPIPRHDHFYPQVNQTTGEPVCLPFMRSLPGQQHLGPRDQINQNSAFLDASQIYGEHTCLARQLRSFGGRLNVTQHPVQGKDLLPNSPVHPECKAPSGYCFIAGDGRASEQPALTAIHTIFMREHNSIARALSAVNPHWDDERLYQHGRRILTAALQHITYNEFLPRLLGWSAVNLYELKLQPQGFYKGYSASCNPSIVNEFATAAFRIGHSLLRPHIPRFGPNYQAIDPPILLRNGFFNPDMIYQANIIDEIIRGLASTPMENLDQFMTGEITNHLFEDRHIPFSGVDLIALNIQRGRDHAIRPYNDYRALCNLKRASSFEDLSREIPAEVITRLKRLYPTVDDIDLFPGGMSERPVQGGLVGPTFACIIGIQFRQLRKCDRFWYENDDPVLKFTEAQLAQIRKITLSKILCDNLDHPGEMQRSAFDQPSSFLNPRVPCHSLPAIDFNAWRETRHGCQMGGRTFALGETIFPSPCTSCICTSEGAQCASLRISDCSQLVRDSGRDAVFRDDVCTAQCGFLLQVPDGDSPAAPLPSRARELSVPIGLLPPPPRQRPRPRPRSPRPAPLGVAFKLPDLSSFVG
ncbi:uncharacterized protein LOC126457994 [Schistocerca serialis cubense]|uniref:uncharacterized protein LOC126457994 n=1 Tax=Schistocerca serialis cubense TaxID=2023355 RepID=UPI00214EE75F|nr:uncharacterized protein LOC126457994 [Schistocerca serialis cubense]